MERVVLHLIHKDDDGRWHLETPAGGDLDAFDSKEFAIDEGKLRCTDLKTYGTDALLVIHREDGTIEDQHTYNYDAERTA